MLSAARPWQVDRLLTAYTSAWKEVEEAAKRPCPTWVRDKEQNKDKLSDHRLKGYVPGIRPSCFPPLLHHLVCVLLYFVVAVTLLGGAPSSCRRRSPMFRSITRGNTKEIRPR